MGGYLIGLGLIIGLFYVLGSFAIEVLRELSNSLFSSSLSELPILPFAILGALLIFGVILRYFFRVVKFPSISLPEFWNAITVLERQEFISYLKNHYKVTYRDTAYLQKISRHKEYLEDIDNRVSTKTRNRKGKTRS